MKKILCILLAVTSIFIGSFIVKAQDTSSIVDESKTYITAAHGPIPGKEGDLPVVVASFGVKNQVKVKDFYIEYTNSDSTTKIILLTDFRLTNDQTFEEFLNGSQVNYEDVIPNDKILYYFKELASEEAFEKEDFTSATYHIEYVTSENKIIVEEGTMTNDNTVTVKSISDITDFIKLLDTASTKFPGLSCFRGDTSSMIFRYDVQGSNTEDSENFIQIGPIVPDPNKTLDDYYKEIEALLQNVTAKVPSDKKVNDSNLSNLKENKTTATYEQKENDKVLYSWTFDGSKMTDEDAKLNINLEVNIGTSANSEKIEKLITATDTHLKLDFKHSGQLPTGTTVTINVTSKFKDNEVLDLYYYNPTKNELEKVSSNITVANGYVKFNLSHCSEYVLMPHKETKEVTEVKEEIKEEVKENSNNPQTSSLNVIAYGLTGIASLAGIVCLLRRKKNEK